MEKTTIQNPFSHIVYVMRGHEDECLYVGRSKQGIARLAKDHKMWAHREEIGSVSVYTLKSRESTVRFERRLTKLLKPKYDESHLAGWVKFGRAKHMHRVDNPPRWTLDYEKVKVLLDRCWPKQGSGRQRALRVICLYYREGQLRSRVAKELGVPEATVEKILYRLTKTINRPAKPRGRPKKNIVTIQTPSGTQGDDSHTSL